jgi:hypothetical protein
MGTICSNTPQRVDDSGEKKPPANAEHPKSPANAEHPKSPANAEHPKSQPTVETLKITWPSKAPSSDADLRALILKPTAEELEKVAKQNIDADKNGYMRIKPNILHKNPFEALRAEPEASTPEAKLKYCNELLLKCYETEDVVFAHHKF